MTHIADLAPVSYSELGGTVRAVGWLEWPHPFRRDPVDPQFKSRLPAILERPHVYYFGDYDCTICAAEGKPGPDSNTSQAVFLVPGPDCVHEAPIWIGHYVFDHSYRPPDEFCDAVMACPAPGSEAFMDAMAAHSSCLEPGNTTSPAADLYEQLMRELEESNHSFVKRLWRRLTV